MKRLILCADDYAIAPGVSGAIRELAAAGRLNATSVMAPGADLGREAERLMEAAPEGFQIGLHVTLTGGLHPLGRPRLAAYDRLPVLMARAFAGRLDRGLVGAEVEAQFTAFAHAFGRPPDFVDGHQHVHVLPGVRDIVIAALLRHAPHAWLRQCGGRQSGAGEGPKGRVIAALSGGLARRAAGHGIATNPAFSGAYRFERREPFAALFPRFLSGLPDGALVMVHPGRVDEALKRADPMHAPREAELAYLSGPKFPQDLKAAGFALA